MAPTGEDPFSVQQALHKAFAGVRLGSGVSIRQSVVIDRYREGHTTEEFNALPRAEVTNDWSAVPDSELEQIAVAHLDAEGYRYYIPALALSILRNYQPVSMRVIGTISSLYPKPETWAYNMQQYSMLNGAQKSALAVFVARLPSLVELDYEDGKCVERAQRNYWSQYAK
jgi:hypothetical protein